MRKIDDYKLNTLNIKREIGGARTPSTIEEVKQIILSANENNLKIWPISSGKNWGYGSSLPVTNNNIILDLGNIKEIKDFNETDGVITITPGVTQQMLYDYLKDTNYITPSTGAGPEVSVLSNLLERGYGLAPIQDHFSSLICLKAILADGSEYNSSLNEIVGEDIGKKFKWGIGPYLNGIFTQSNFAVVTEVTIQLAKKSEHTELVKFCFNNENLELVINMIKNHLHKYPSLLSGVNLMNQERMLAMGIKQSYDWTCIFAINSDKSFVGPIKKSIKKGLKNRINLNFISKRKIDFLKIIPLPQNIKRDLAAAEEMYHILGGRPTRLALNLCYLKNPEQKKTFDPDKDNCGLIWYSPLVEMNYKSVSDYISFIRSTSKKYKMEPLITLTSLNHMIFDSTIPILFSKDDLNNETLNAHNCYNELLRIGREKGFFPYRMGVAHMEELTKMAPKFFDIQGLIKKALDPKNIIAPGRYSKY